MFNNRPGLLCENATLPPCLQADVEVNHTGHARPVVINPEILFTKDPPYIETLKAKYGRSQVEVSMRRRSNEKENLWKGADTDECATSETTFKQPTVAEWRQNDKYMGAQLTFQCLPRYNTWPINWHDGPSNNILVGLKKVWVNDMTIYSKEIALRLQLSAPSIFSASMLVLESTHPSIICFGNQGTYLNVQLSYIPDTDTDTEYQLYTNHLGEYQFDCKTTDTNCKIPLQPPLVSSQIRLKMRCLGPSANKFKIEDSDQVVKSAHREEDTFYGFADPEISGKGMRVKVGFKTEMMDFDFTPVVKDELQQMLSTPRHDVNCTDILQSCILDAHFTSWKIPEYGTFEQAPAIGKAPIMLKINNEVWNMTVSKKRLVTAEVAWSCRTL